MAFATIDKGSKYFNGLAYSGNDTATSYNNGLDMSTNGGLVWLKTRSAAGDHGLFDSVRGVNKRIRSNTTNAEDTLSSNGVTSFNSTGFSLGTVAYNDTPYTFMSWSWIAGGTGVSNTAGTISSTVSANTTSGFSIVSYTGTGSVGTVGHGLGVTPACFITKCRSNASTSWGMYHQSVGNTAFMELNGTAAKQTNIAYFNNTSPTSSVFTIGTDTINNGNGYTFIAYCFAEVKGFSKFGSYTGNGSSDGTFIYTGFKPAWVMTKQTNGANSWHIHDNKRNLFNVVNTQLKAESSGADDTPAGGENSRDFLSNGFKFRNADHNNQSGQTYIYMAFAESPFVSSKGLPTTAR